MNKVKCKYKVSLPFLLFLLFFFRLLLFLLFILFIITVIIGGILLLGSSSQGIFLMLRQVMTLII